MEFKNTYYLIPGVIWLLFWLADYFKWFKKSELILPQGKAKKGRSFRLLIALLCIAGILFISFSLMQPRRPEGFSESTIDVNDIFIVLDVSRSMLAEDIRPNRLEVAKEKLREFVRMKPKDRLALIIFSEKVYTLLPLTIDPTLMDKVIDDINIGYLGSGTNIGDALGVAVARAYQSEAKNKVIVLLTDGVSNVGNLTPLQAAEEAKKLNVKIYTIGLGTDEDARLPMGDGVFGKRYTTIPGGSIDMETLKKVSDLTGGKSYKSENANSLSETLEDINNLERTKIKADQQIVYEEVYYIYFAIGLFLYFLGEFLRRFLMGEWQ